MSALRLFPLGNPAPRSVIGESKRPITGLLSLLLFSLLIVAWRLLAISGSGATLYVDEAQYWLWGRHLEWGYFSKPPGIAVFTRLSTALFGDGLLGVKALAMLCYPLAAGFAFLIARRLYDGRSAWWSALIVMTLPIYAWLGLFASTDALLTVCWLAGIWCYLRALDGDRWFDWLALGLVAGLGLLSKYTMLVFIAAAFLHLCCFHRARLLSFGPWIALLVALVMIAPNLAWNVAHDFPTLRHTAEITLQRQAGDRIGALSGFLAAQWLALGPLFGCMAVIALWRWRKLRRNPGHGILLWFALPLWIVVGFQAAMGGANANWAAPALAPAAVAMAGWLVSEQRYKALIAGVLVNLMLAALAYHAPSLLKASDMANPGRYNPFIRATGWDELGRQFRPFLEAHPDAVLLADNRTVLAHFAYELRDLKPEIVSWNPEGRAGDHFKLTTDLGRHPGRDALLIIDHLPDTALLGRYSAVRHLATLKVAAGSASPRPFEVFLLHEFKGY